MKDTVQCRCMIHLLCSANKLWVMHVRTACTQVAGARGAHPRVVLV